VPKAGYNLADLNFSLRINGEIRQQGNTKLMLFNFDTIIAYVSRFFTLKTGDIIFTGTPQGVGPVQVGDRLEAFIQDKPMLSFEVK
jgi:2-keto-4-pentenoate hydratase/2-oxohepta-3-ene-1,7-dioic acid hydratase in catechol pathway